MKHSETVYTMARVAEYLTPAEQAEIIAGYAESIYPDKVEYNDGVTVLCARAKKAQELIYLTLAAEQNYYPTKGMLAAMISATTTIFPHALQARHDLAGYKFGKLKVERDNLHALALKCGEIII